MELGLSLAIKIPIIVAYLGCSAGRTHFVRTKRLYLYILHDAGYLADADAYLGQDRSNGSNGLPMG